MNLRPSTLPDVMILEPRITEDERGFFTEVFNARELAKVGIGPEFVQDNHSGSRHGVLRGLHYQIRHPQGKLVWVIVGEIFDVAVDLRKGSSTFGQWAGSRLSAANRLQQWTPIGFAHGFYVVSEWAEVIYKVTDYYAPADERTLRWDDPRLAIAWPLVGGKPPIVSDKDSRGNILERAETFE